MKYLILFMLFPMIAFAQIGPGNPEVNPNKQLGIVDEPINPNPNQNPESINPNPNANPEAQAVVCPLANINCSCITAGIIIILLIINVILTWKIYKRR